MHEPRKRLCCYCAEQSTREATSKLTTQLSYLTSSSLSSSFVHESYTSCRSGFLSTDDMAAPGNLGLYDQIAALRWVKRNIQSFGGNNDDITLMGHDAGAISAGLLLLAPHETQGESDQVTHLIRALTN